MVFRKNMDYIKQIQYKLNALLKNLDNYNRFEIQLYHKSNIYLIFRLKLRKIDYMKQLINY